MNIFVVQFLFSLLKLSILVNLTTSGEIGETACSYSGGFDRQEIFCSKDGMMIDDLPEECSSYFYEGLTVDPDLSIVATRGDPDFAIIYDLGRHKPDNVFVYYRRKNIGEDSYFIGDPSAEAERAKVLVRQYLLGGLILQNVAPNGGDFYKSFSEYIKAFKTKMPDLKIGLSFNATEFLCRHNDPAWFDFSKMNGDLDFYVIEFDNFNVCTDELLHSGITPMESENPEVNTLNKFAEAFCASTIAKDKVYFEFLIAPLAKPEKLKAFLPCEFSYSEYCSKNRDQIWCVDNENSLYEKGQFAKQKSKGFIAKNIDLVDRDLKCNCNNDKFVTFYMLLKGFKGEEQITCGRLEG